MNKLADSLRRDHEQLEALLVKLAEDPDSRDPRRLQETWGEFESCLIRHLQTEEQHLLPRFVASHPDEVRSTVTDHERISKLVAELDVGADLHIVRKDALLRLVRMLREHAQAEDRSLYRWIHDYVDTVPPSE